MSFRTEIKIKIEPFMESHFFKWLSINNGMEIYSKRRVTSIYFDNDKLESYNDSIEGTVPRKKIRLRTYNEFKFNEFQKVLLEKKISSIEGRYKTSIQISNYMSSDKKNNDKKINLILLKKIGQTTRPNTYKISTAELEKVFSKII